MADVLLVDDNEKVLLTLSIALRRFGHVVTDVLDAQQALNHLQRHHFTFLISDVRMAGMNGIELATRARQLPHPPRVILMSAYSNIETHEGLAEAFLRKPINIQQLHALLCDEEPVNTLVERRNGNNPSVMMAQASIGSESAPPKSIPAKFHTALDGDASTCDASPRCDASAQRSMRSPYGTIFG
jgi:CheY-like chemotaxis protein